MVDHLTWQRTQRAGYVDQFKRGIFFSFRGVKATCFRGRTTRVGITKSGLRVATTRDGIVQLFTTDGEYQTGWKVSLSLFLEDKKKINSVYCRLREKESVKDSSRKLFPLVGNFVKTRPSPPNTFAKGFVMGRSLFPSFAATFFRAPKNKFPYLLILNIDRTISVD